MQFAKSYFNPTLMKKNVTRFWPIWGLFFLILLFALPLAIYVQRVGFEGNGYYIKNVAMATVALVCCFAPLCAMGTFSYLFQSRSAYMIHGLPIRREGLFLTNYLSGYLFLLVPGVVALALGWMVSAAVGSPISADAMVEFLAYLVFSITFFYSFSVLCGMLTGNLLGLPAFYGILSFLAPALTALLGTMTEAFLYGFVTPDHAWTVAQWLSPPIKFMQQAYNVEVLGIYAAVGVLMAIASFLLYRIRHVERAGDLVVVGAVRPIFKYLAALTVSVAMTWLWMAIFELNISVVALGVLLVLWGVVGYFLAEMILQKSFRVFKKAWKGAAGMAVVMIALTLCLGFDVTGYETRVPSADKVVSMESTLMVYGVNNDSLGRNMVITDPDAIAAVVKFHSRVAQLGERYGGPGFYTNGQFSVTYTLKNGTTISRNYQNVYLFDQDDQGLSIQEADEVLANKEVIRAGYAPLTTPGRTPSSVTWSNQGETQMSTQEAIKLQQAVLADLEAGNLAQVRTIENGRYQEEEEDLSKGGRKEGYLYFEFGPLTLNNASTYVDVAIFEGMTHTKAALSEILDRADW